MAQDAEDRGAWGRFHCRCSPSFGGGQIRGWVLRFGSRVRVIEREELRQLLTELTEEARKVLTGEKTCLHRP